jgi:hypothetical protein
METRLKSWIYWNRESVILNQKAQARLWDKRRLTGSHELLVPANLSQRPVGVRRLLCRDFCGRKEITDDGEGLDSGKALMKTNNRSGNSSSNNPSGPPAHRPQTSKCRCGPLPFSFSNNSDHLACFDAIPLFHPDRLLVHVASVNPNRGRSWWRCRTVMGREHNHPRGRRIDRWFQVIVVAKIQPRMEVIVKAAVVRSAFTKEGKSTR